MDEIYKEELMSDDNNGNSKKIGCGLFRRNGVDKEELWETGCEYPCRTQTASSMPSYVTNLFATAGHSGRNWIALSNSGHSIQLLQVSPFFLVRAILESWYDLDW